MDPSPRGLPPILRAAGVAFGTALRRWARELALAARAAARAGPAGSRPGLDALVAVPELRDRLGLEGIYGLEEATVEWIGDGEVLRVRAPLVVARRAATAGLDLQRIEVRGLDLSLRSGGVVPLMRALVEHPETVLRAAIHADDARVRSLVHGGTPGLRADAARLTGVSVDLGGLAGPGADPLARVAVDAATVERIARGDLVLDQVRAEDLELEMRGAPPERWPPERVTLRCTTPAAEVGRLRLGGIRAGPTRMTGVEVTDAPAGLTATATAVHLVAPAVSDPVVTARAAAVDLDTVAAGFGPRFELRAASARIDHLAAWQDLIRFPRDDAHPRSALVRAATGRIARAAIDADLALHAAPVPVRWRPAVHAHAEVADGQVDPGHTGVTLEAPRLRLLWLELHGVRLDPEGRLLLDAPPRANLAPVVNAALGRPVRRRIPLAIGALAGPVASLVDPPRPVPLRGRFDGTVALAPGRLEVLGQQVVLGSDDTVRVVGDLGAPSGRVVARWERLRLGEARIHLGRLTCAWGPTRLRDGRLAVGDRADGLRIAIDGATVRELRLSSAG